MDCHWYINCILLFSASGEGNGNPLQYSCLENATDRGSWWAIVLGVTESDTTERAHTHTFSPGASVIWRDCFSHG